MLTTAQRRAHYDEFVTQVIGLCADNGIRADLTSGRGRPVEECDRMQEHLTRHVARYGARRAHYTIATLIAMQRHLAEQGPYTPEFPARTGDEADITSGAENATEPNLHRPPGEAADAPAPQHLTPAGQPMGERAAWRRRPNLGTTLAIAVARHGFKESRMTERVKTLTKLASPLLHPRLWTLGTHLHNHGAARLDFAVLLEDLAWWDHDQPQVATRWRESYFLTLDALSPDMEH
ncbi:type I-E CRISPR-associated protein Cse2/CasB [Streptomyces triticiradicis]|uniref:CRISPR-associated protein Cse2 n=1 Tax=Streptomyces triticiradicis TaxID=2651189 RepID=A0A7J5DF22_9ACTN|nr:type I-E CRISPR-associated protein Cse2/CasB [Streptomyces triticiradicis]KAB1987468.1 CRISPR-associated protein Cse2 [Streptomyces triticiradicis]